MAVSSISSSTSALDNQSSSSSAATAAASGTDALANTSTFLTLLVTQLKNQNPMDPMDGTAFVSQLATFSNLEQNVAMRGDLDTLTAKYAPSMAAPTSTDNNSGS